MIVGLQGQDIRVFVEQLRDASSHLGGIDLSGRGRGLQIRSEGGVEQRLDAVRAARAARLRAATG